MKDGSELLDRTSARCAALAALALSMVVSVPARAQTGVSDDRVVLPDGPGSIEGIGDNVSVDGNMGSMSYSVPIEVPQGYPGMTPELALSYSSGSGAGLLGVGWSMQVPSIERLTLRGLPRYVADDEFAADGSEQLVRVSGSGQSAVYRARFERGFVRYTWHAIGDGSAGYWTAEYPDGRIGYFGARADGTLVHEARLESAAGDTFRYLLVETVDVHGHAIRYEYAKSGVTPLLRRIGWVFESGSSAPRYAIELDYEERPDPISDAEPGFEELMTQRLWFVRVRSRGEAIRSYRVSYEDEATSGGFSRVSQIERLGRDGNVYPVVHRFSYSRSLGGVCGGARCDRQFVVDMGTLSGAAGIGTGDATLVDINGDALPDLVDSSRSGGMHRFYMNVLEGEGRSRFSSASVDSTTTPVSGFQLRLPYVKVLDVNGDGFADLVNARDRLVRCNDATGDWTESGCGVLREQLDLRDDSDPGDGDTDPLRTRFVDLNGDRRIDILHTNGANQAEAWLNTETGFSRYPVEPIGRQFDGDRLQLADMNGDGLLDPVVIESHTLRYRLALGWGQWSGDDDEDPWVTAEGFETLSESDMNDAELQDLNGDGLDDLVIVQGSTVRYALNRRTGRFDPFVEIEAADVDGELPVRDTGTTVLFADMNGNGSQDPVWVESSGRVRFLEMFPVRPNLMSRLENGLGMVHEITYGTSVAHQAASETPWRYDLPHAMQVVDRTDTWVTLTGGDEGEGLHEVIEHAYRDGFYDGVEKAFRGFARVERRMLAELSRDSQEPALTVEEYDVGAEDPYRAGLLLSSQLFSGADRRPIRESRSVYGECDVAGIDTNPDVLTPLGEPDVRFVCEREQLTIHQEGQPPEAWITTLTETAYDGYGNAILTSEHGVAHLGPPEMRGGCEPCEASADGRYGRACGPECLGDEQIEERTYVVPGPSTSDRWILAAIATTRSYADHPAEARESRVHYDGADFAGLPVGRLTLGLATRVEARVSETEWIDEERHAYDAHGNVLSTIDPNGSIDDEQSHRRSYEYDSEHLRVVRTRVHLTTPEGEPYRLLQEYAYDPSFDQIAFTTGWMIEGLGVASARNPTTYLYDEFGRLTGIVEPGDTADAPTTEIAWELGDPASRILVRRRTAPDGVPELASARCIDGLGREFQELTRVREGEWLASGFTEYNRRGAQVRVHQPHTVTSGSCATRPPDDVRAVEVQYDGAGREIRRRMPDGDERDGLPSQRTIEYQPLATITHDENDTDAASPHQGTPDVVRVDGLERPIALERLLRTDDGDLTATTALFYDGRGDLAGYVDALGHVKTQERDRLGRIVRMSDPSTGVVTLELDAAGNVIARTDAREVTTRTDYDGANRPLAAWDDAAPDVTRIRYRYDFSPECAASECGNAEGRVVEVAYPLPEEIGAPLGGSIGRDRSAYDPRGRVVRQARRVGDLELATEHRYDGADRAVRTIYPDGQAIVRELDGANRIVGIEGLIERVEYDERGLLERIVHPDGSAEESRHDALMRLASAAAMAGDGTVLHDLTYSRDREGRITSIVDAAPLPARVGAGTARFTHDSFDRLIGATIGAATADDETLSYSYDLVDNLLRATSDHTTSRAHVGEYHYAGGRPSIATQVGELLQSHDEAGNLVARAGTEFEWDFLDRLTRARDDGAVVGVFAYGAGPERVAKLEGDALTIYLGDAFEVRDGVSRVYARLGRERLARSQSAALGPSIYGDPDGDGVLTAADAILEPDARRRSSLLQATARRLLHDAAPDPVQFFHDHLGSLIAATRGGETVGLRRYHPFGEIRAESGFIDERGFTGQERDESTGLLHFQWRYLDAYAGQWASADPAFEAVALGEDDDVVARLLQTIGRHVYVGQAPIDRFDATGLDWNYRLRQRGGRVYYVGRASDSQTPQQVMARHANNIGANGVPRFRPGGADQLEMITRPGTRRNAVRGIEQLGIEQHGTLIGRGSGHVRGNEIDGIRRTSPRRAGYLRAATAYLRGRGAVTARNAPRVPLLRPIGRFTR